LLRGEESRMVSQERDQCECVSSHHCLVECDATPVACPKNARPIVRENTLPAGSQGACVRMRPCCAQRQCTCQNSTEDGRCFSPVSNFHAAKRTHGASDVVNHGAVVCARKTHPSGDFTRRPMQPRLTIAASLSPSLQEGSVWWVVVNIPVTFCCCGDAMCAILALNTS